MMATTLDKRQSRAPTYRKRRDTENLSPGPGPSDRFFIDELIRAARANGNKGTRKWSGSDFGIMRSGSFLQKNERIS